MKKLAILFAMILTGAALADPPTSRLVDFDSVVSAPSLSCYQYNQKTYTWTLKNNGAAVNGSGYSPVMFIASSNQAPVATTAVCAWTSISNGVFTATLTPAMLSAAGQWVYAVGIYTGSLTTIAQMGQIKITSDKGIQ